MLTRRQFLARSAAAGGGLYLVSRMGEVQRVRAAASSTLAPSSVAKYVTPLVIPPAMPRTAKLKAGRGEKQIDYYEIAVRQFHQQILPDGNPATTVWGYGSINHPASFNYPSFTIEAKWRAPVRVRWINDLIDPTTGHFLPHLLPIDQTLHWANPPAGVDGRDHAGTDPTPYRGPVPLVTHVHGAHTTDESDGYTEAWYLPAANDIPGGYATIGSWYDTFRAEFLAERAIGHPSDAWAPGSATFQYPNDQAAATLWYHDHSLGMTRANVYAGPAGFFLLRGGPRDLKAGLPGPAPSLGDPPGARYHEIPLAIQDRSFDVDGSLFYPDSRAFFDGFEGPYIGDPDQPSDIPPIWNPEVFSNAMLVNGKTWPTLTVEPQRYRFRLLNGCNARFLILKLTTGDPEVRPAIAALPIWQIGAEGGFLPAAVMLDEVLMSPAERADVIVDFSGLPRGTEVFLVNEGPDEPFGGGVAGVDFPYADPSTTGQVMRFVVGRSGGADHSLPPDELALPPRTPLPAAVVTRRVSLNEEDSRIITDEASEPVGPRAALLGTVEDDHGVPMGMPMMWMDAITENPAVGATEVWEIHNYTMDAHPIHVHEVMFEVLDRQPFDMETGSLGLRRPPERTETGTKDTVIAYPAEITRLKATFDLPGLYVWHCHIVEHEDNEMMRPYAVGPVPDRMP